MEELVLLEIQLKAFLNMPYAYKDICLIYPLTIKDIVSIGQTNYSAYLSLLTMDEFDIMNNAKKKNIDINVEQINTFRFLIDSAKRNYTFLLEFKNAFRTFIREEINILYDDYIIVIGDGTDKRFLDSNNFDEFQNIIRIQNKRSVKVAPPPDETPLRRKFRLKAEYRDAIKRNQQSNDPDAPNLCALLSCLCCYDHLTPSQLENYSFYAFRENFERHQLKDKYEIDIKSILAGADSKKIKPVPWQKKISN